MRATGKEGETQAASALALHKLERELLSVHAAVEAKTLCLAAEALIKAAVPCWGIAMGFSLATYAPLFLYSMLYGFGRDENWQGHFDPVNCPTMKLVQAQPGRKFIFDTDLFASDAEMRTHPYYKAVMQPEGWEHSMSMSFWKGKATRGFLVVMRKMGEPDFSAEEAAVLRALYPHLKTALERVIKIHATDTIKRSLSWLLDRLPLPSVVLDWDLRVLHRNHAAEDFCAVWNYGAEKAAKLTSSAVFRIPAEAIQECHRLRSIVEESIMAGPCSDFAMPAAAAPIIHPGQPNLALTIRLLDFAQGQAHTPRFLLEFHRIRPDSGNLDAIERPEEKLSRRELEVAMLVCEGLSNAEISDRLGRTLGTIKKQVSSTFSKLEVSRRSQLIKLFS